MNKANFAFFTNSKTQKTPARFRPKSNNHIVLIAGFNILPMFSSVIKKQTGKCLFIRVSVALHPFEAICENAAKLIKFSYFLYNSGVKQDKFTELAYSKLSIN
jgi:hypothetical protein